MILLLTDVQVILRLHEFLLLLLLGRCQSTLPDTLYAHPRSSFSLTSFYCLGLGPHPLRSVICAQ